jgi:hypothetical protein
MPPIVEPPAPDNQVETPTPEPPTTEKLEDIVVSPPQEKHQKSDIPMSEIPEIIEPEPQVAIPTTDTDKDQKVAKLIDEEPPKDLKGFAGFSDKVNASTGDSK